MHKGQERRGARTLLRRLPFDTLRSTEKDTIGQSDRHNKLCPQRALDPPPRQALVVAPQFLSSTVVAGFLGSCRRLGGGWHVNTDADFIGKTLPSAARAFEETFPSGRAIDRSLRRASTVSIRLSNAGPSNGKALNVGRLIPPHWLRPLKMCLLITISTVRNPEYSDRAGQPP